MLIKALTLCYVAAIILSTPPECFCPKDRAHGFSQLQLEFFKNKGTNILLNVLSYVSLRFNYIAENHLINIIPDAQITEEKTQYFKKAETNYAAKNNPFAFYKAKKYIYADIIKRTYKIKNTTFYVYVFKLNVNQINWTMKLTTRNFLLDKIKKDSEEERDLFKSHPLEGIAQQHSFSHFHENQFEYDVCINYQIFLIKILRKFEILKENMVDRLTGLSKPFGEYLYDNPSRRCVIDEAKFEKYLNHSFDLGDDISQKFDPKRSTVSAKDSDNSKEFTKEKISSRDSVLHSEKSLNLENSISQPFNQSELSDSNDGSEASEKSKSPSVLINSNNSPTASDINKFENPEFQLHGQENQSLSLNGNPVFHRNKSINREPFGPRSASEIFLVEPEDRSFEPKFLNQIKRNNYNPNKPQLDSEINQTQEIKKQPSEMQSLDNNKPPSSSTIPEDLINLKSFNGIYYSEINPSNSNLSSLSNPALEEILIGSLSQSNSLGNHGVPVREEREKKLENSILETVGEGSFISSHPRNSDNKLKENSGEFDLEKSEISEGSSSFSPNNGILKKVNFKINELPDKKGKKRSNPDAGIITTNSLSMLINGNIATSLESPELKSNIDYNPLNYPTEESKLPNYVSELQNKADPNSIFLDKSKIPSMVSISKVIDEEQQKKLNTRENESKLQASKTLTAEIPSKSKLQSKPDKSKIHFDNNSSEMKYNPSELSRKQLKKIVIKMVHYIKPYVNIPKSLLNKDINIAQIEKRYKESKSKLSASPSRDILNSEAEGSKLLSLKESNDMARFESTIFLIKELETRKIETELPILNIPKSRPVNSMKFDINCMIADRLFSPTSFVPIFNNKIDSFLDENLIRHPGKEFDLSNPELWNPEKIVEHTRYLRQINFIRVLIKELNSLTEENQQFKQLNFLIDEDLSIEFNNFTLVFYLLVTILAKSDVSYYQRAVFSNIERLINEKKGNTAPRLDIIDLEQESFRKEMNKSSKKPEKDIYNFLIRNLKVVSQEETLIPQAHVLKPNII
jgi:hypothetical protein